MKHSILTLGIALFATAAFAADEVSRTTTTTTTGGTTGTGTITEYSPGKTFVVKESSGPVTYHYGKHVTYVTKSGAAIPDAEVRTRIKVGAPVHVHYVTEGSNRVIDRVELED